MNRPPRLLRRNAFFGLYFDLDPSDADTPLGGGTSGRNMQDLLKWKRGDPRCPWAHCRSVDVRAHMSGARRVPRGAVAVEPR